MHSYIFGVTKAPFLFCLFNRKKNMYIYKCGFPEYNLHNTHTINIINKIIISTINITEN